MLSGKAGSNSLTLKILPCGFFSSASSYSGILPSGNDSGRLSYSRDPHNNLKRLNDSYRGRPDIVGSGIGVTQNEANVIVGSYGIDVRVNIDCLGLLRNHTTWK